MRLVEGRARGSKAGTSFESLIERGRGARARLQVLEKGFDSSSKTRQKRTFKVEHRLRREAKHGESLQRLIGMNPGTRLISHTREKPVRSGYLGIPMAALRTQVQLPSGKKKTIVTE